MQIKEYKSVWPVQAWLFEDGPAAQESDFSFFCPVVMYLFQCLAAFIAEHTEKRQCGRKVSIVAFCTSWWHLSASWLSRSFYNFTSLALQALSERKPWWTYFPAVDFVFQTFTTVGKSIHAKLRWSSSITLQAYLSPKSNKQLLDEVFVISQKPNLMII